MEEKNNKCYKCLYFNRYYTKGIKRFIKTKFGWCCKKNDNVEMHCSCNEFRQKNMKFSSRRGFKSYLNDLLTEITEMRLLFEAENSEDEEM